MPCVRSDIGGIIQSTVLPPFKSRRTLRRVLPVRTYSQIRQRISGGRRINGASWLFLTLCDIVSCRTVNHMIYLQFLLVPLRCNIQDAIAEPVEPTCRPLDYTILAVLGGGLLRHRRCFSCSRSWCHGRRGVSVESVCAME
jgi:hypothetical protein